MSALAYTQFDYSLIKKKVSLFAVVDVGAAGAVTLEAWSPSEGAAAGSYAAAGTTPANAFSPTGTQGVASVTKEATAGQWTFAFQGSFQRLLGVRRTCLVATTGISTTADIGVVGTSPGVTSDPGTITTQLVDFAGVAVNPADGERVLVEFILDDSSAI